MSSQVGGTPTQVLPVGMLPSKYIHREESPSPPPLPTSLPPVYQSTQTIPKSVNNNNNNIVSGFAKMGMEDDEEDKKPKPGMSLLANLPPPPERRPMTPQKKPKPKIPSTSQEKPEEEEPQYTGYINPRKQSASFMRLAQTLNTDATGAGGGLISSQEDLSSSRFARSPSRGTPEPSQQLPRLQSPNGQMVQSISNSIASTGSRGSRGSSNRSSISESQGGEDYDLESRRDSHPQSRSFLMLQQHLEDDGTPKSVFDKAGGPSAPNPELPCPAGVTPIKPAVSINKNNIAPGNVTRKSLGNIALHNCYYCGNTITGRFSRVHGHPFHQNCFRCKICRMDLIDAGYFWIEDNMYCQTHALQVAKPPAPGMVPVILN